MGAEGSREPPAEYDTPWRTIDWGTKEDLKRKLMEFEVDSSNVKQVRILLAGEVGAGKSSFINSISSAFQNRITSDVLVDATSGKSFTKIYKTHNIRCGKSILPFVFNDIMGLESVESDGAHPEDIIKALEGLLKEGMKFNPASPVAVGGEGYRSDPRLEHQTYCLVYIIAADKVTEVRRNVYEKLAHIREKASELDIPQVIIMTRVDEACPLVQKDLKKIYTSKKIKQKMEACSNVVGVPMCHIFPVKNYHEESDPDAKIDVLVLKALTHIVQLANDKLYKKTYEQSVNCD